SRAAASRSLRWKSLAPLVRNRSGKSDPDPLTAGPPVAWLVRCARRPHGIARGRVAGEKQRCPAESRAVQRSPATTALRFRRARIPPPVLGLPWKALSRKVERRLAHRRRRARWMRADPFGRPVPNEPFCGEGFAPRAAPCRPGRPARCPDECWPG